MAENVARQPTASPSPGAGRPVLVVAASRRYRAALAFPGISTSASLAAAEPSVSPWACRAAIVDSEPLNMATMSEKAVRSLLAPQPGREHQAHNIETE